MQCTNIITIDLLTRIREYHVQKAMTLFLSSIFNKLCRQHAQCVSWNMQPLSLTGIVKISSRPKFIYSPWIGPTLCTDGCPQNFFKGQRVKLNLPPTPFTSSFILSLIQSISKVTSFTVFLLRVKILKIARWKRCNSYHRDNVIFSIHHMLILHVGLCHNDARITALFFAGSSEILLTDRKY